MARKAQPTKDDPKVETTAGADAETPESPAEGAQAAAQEQAQAKPDEITEEYSQEQETEEEGAQGEEQEPEEELPAKPADKTQPATRARMVDAKLLARHCRGGICKEKGETMRMTAGEYARLKQYGRVE